jgi:hypothetical protein
MFRGSLATIARWPSVALRALNATFTALTLGSDLAFNVGGKEYGKAGNKQSGE